MSLSYVERKNNYITKNVNSTNYYSILLQAFQNLPLQEDLLKSLFENYQKEVSKTKDNSDFLLILFIRLLYLLKKNNHSQYQTIFASISILLNDERFWLTKGEKSKCYWSENHMICYLSSWYLWNQLNNKSDTQCNLLLETYLDSKSKYYFYECFSQVYNTYTLSALLNIYDFTNNNNHKVLSEKCISILCKQFCEVNLLNGSTFCASGRTYERYKLSSSNNNYNKLMHLLNGYNQEDSISPIGSFMCTSSYIHNYELNKTFTNNYEATYLLSNVNFDKVYKSLSKEHKTLFQWSAGNYFNEYVDDSIDLMNKYDLAAHAHFKLEPYDTILRIFPTSLLKSSVNTLKAFTDCSDLTNISYHIYNNGLYSLTSLEGYNRGKMGAQQLPWIANVNGCSVFTQSGKVSSVGNLDEATGNSHLPCIKQIKNVLLMMYQPYDLLKTYSKSANLDLNVYLYVNHAGFNSVIQNKNWIFARKDDAYIAIYSTTLKKDNENNYYNDNTQNQGWIIILGSVNEDQSFENFQNQILTKSSVQFKVVKPNKNIFDKLTTSDNYYYGKVVYKNITFDMKW
jgi:hypothetical protein